MLCSAKLVGEPSISSWSFRPSACIRGKRRCSLDSATFLSRGRADEEWAIASWREASASGTAVPQKPHSALTRPMYHCERPQPGQWFDSLAR